MASDRDDIRRLLDGWAEPSRLRRLEARRQDGHQARRGRLHRLLRRLSRR